VIDNRLVGRHPKMRTGVLGSGIRVGAARREELLERRVAEDILDFFELYRHRNDPAGALPYGLQKLVSVARALAAEPSVLLLDEPCTGLIREERENLARFLLRVRYEMGPTIIWVEHDMQMVSDLADRVIVLNYGVKVTEGRPGAPASRHQPPRPRRGAPARVRDLLPCGAAILPAHPAPLPGDRVAAQACTRSHPRLGAVIDRDLPRADRARDRDRRGAQRRQ